MTDLRDDLEQMIKAAHLRIMMVPAPHLKALQWKRQHRGDSAGYDWWIEKDEKRLARKQRAKP